MQDKNGTELKIGDSVQIHANPGRGGHAHGSCTGVIRGTGPHARDIRVEINGKYMELSPDHCVPFTPNELTKL